MLASRLRFELVTDGHSKIRGGVSHARCGKIGPSDFSIVERLGRALLRVVQVSNLPPPVLETGALPDELTPHA